MNTSRRNITAYAYCKDYREYWDWVEKRNESRYENTIEHGKNYDSKNLMHTFRLLEMAKEIAETGIVNVKRPNREGLLKIKSGAFQYEDLVKKAEVLRSEVEAAFKSSNLPEKLNMKFVNELLVSLRAEYYQ